MYIAAQKSGLIIIKLNTIRFYQLIYEKVINNGKAISFEKYNKSLLFIGNGKAGLSIIDSTNKSDIKILHTMDIIGYIYDIDFNKDKTVLLEAGRGKIISLISILYILLFFLGKI